MNTTQSPDYSVIIPSRGDRPKALAMAINSVLQSAQEASYEASPPLSPPTPPAITVEILVGFDGVQGERVSDSPAVRYYDLPTNNDFGNALRQSLLKASKGRRIIFLDDDNILTLTAFSVYEQYSDADMLVARIDVSRAHDIPYLPVEKADKPLIRPCNIDPLCLCLTRDLVVTRCGGWQGERYEADYHNILRYSRRATSLQISTEIVGIYDAGRGLDATGRNFRQQQIID